MLESGNKSYIAKKSYEVAYALLRIAPKIQESGISRGIADGAANVLVESIKGEYGNALNQLEVVDYLIKLAIDLNTISFVGSDILLGEIINLKSIIEGEYGNAQGQTIDISEFLKASDPIEKAKNEVQRNRVSPHLVPASRPLAVQNKSPEREQEIGSSLQGFQQKSEPNQNTAIIERESDIQSGNIQANTFLKSGMRQMAILDKIRQSGNCKLRDIQEVLPDTSERTIRYDLEDLIERNLIERVGAGGPAIYYKIRQSV